MLLQLKEHQVDKYSLSCWLDDIPYEPLKTKYLGLHYDFWKGKKTVRTSYFIGACWLEAGHLALQVEPKIDNIDYLSMFITCFKQPVVGKTLSDIYQINFNQSPIPLSGSNFDITPLLIVHFLQVVKAIVRKGLKKGYYRTRQNFNAKIKGKINIKGTLRHNIFKAKSHQTLCDYQEFGLDCIENRLIKKALKFVQSYLTKSVIKTEINLKETLSYCLAPFVTVSDDINSCVIKKFKNNAFFKEYSSALILAKIILKRFSYQLKNTGMQNLTPPFWVDMSLLFEKYVYTLLLEKHQLEYQFKHTDFIVDDMIIDTKYKPQSLDKVSDDDIAQLSRYGRNLCIREKLGITEEVAKCLIIYPSKMANVCFSIHLWEEGKEIKNYKNIKKIAIKLPCHGE